MKETLTDEQMGVQGRVSGINTKKNVREAIVLKMVEKKTTTNGTVLVST